MSGSGDQRPSPSGSSRDIEGIVKRDTTPRSAAFGMRESIAFSEPRGVFVLILAALLIGSAAAGFWIERRGQGAAQAPPEPAPAPEVTHEQAPEQPAAAIVPQLPPPEQPAPAQSGFGSWLSSTGTALHQRIEEIKKIVAKETPQPTAPAPQPAPAEPVLPPLSALSAEECAARIEASEFYVDTGSQVAKRLAALESAGNKTDAGLLRQIACNAHGVWITGSDPKGDRAYVEKVVAAAALQGTIPLIVLYHVSDAKVAEWENGMTEKEYHDWIWAIAGGIGEAPAWVILEPDALPTSYAYAPKERSARASELREAVRILTTEAPNARVYIDAGHSQWASPDKAAALLKDAGVDMARGFSINVSNFRTTAQEKQYGIVLSSQLGGKHFIIDTSRNGNGPSGTEWCNARGRAIGEPPRIIEDGSALDALLWVKPPGESDGYCNGGPAPGEFWLAYALELVKNRRR